MVIKQIKDKIKEYRSKETETTAECWSCRNHDMVFTVPKKGYLVFRGQCSVCGVAFIAMSNYGLITTFPIEVWAKHQLECEARQSKILLKQ